MSASELDLPNRNIPTPENEDEARQLEHQLNTHLMLDQRNPEEANRYVLDPMYRTTRWFWVLLVILGGALAMELGTWTFQMIWGMGVTGLNRPVMWALYIVDFVYFIGIGHAGTFISAALRVLKFEFRRPISRAAEVLTVFALITAATFPVIHLGRSWKAYWLLPYPNQRLIWPSFHSPLLWDLTAITTYLTCSILFAWIALIPDLAMARDNSTGWRHRLYEMLAWGWRGTEHEWGNQETALNVFSYAIIPVMFSVHTIVSWDFAMALQPGWHSTVFGPYFVVGALFSGAGAVVMVLALLRKFLNLKFFLRPEHFNGMGVFLLILSMTWTYFYFNDFLAPWYGQEPVEKLIDMQFFTGTMAPFWYTMLFCNIVIPFSTLWSRKVRQSPWALFIVSVFIQVGMYLERTIIVPITLGKNEIPAAWGVYIPHAPEIMITIGAFSGVVFFYLIFTRLFPVIPVWEVYEGWFLHRIRRIGKALVQSKSEPD